VLQNRAFELLQSGARLDPQLVDEQAPRLPINIERIRLPPRAVKRQHEQTAEALAEWVLADENLEFRDELAVPAKLEVGLNAPFERAEAKLLEAEDLRMRERLVCEIGECRPAPQTKGIAKKTRGHLRLCVLRVLDEPLEPEQIELVRSELEEIARLPCDDRRVWSKRLP